MSAAPSNRHWFDAILQRKRVVLASAFALCLAGAVSFATMPRQEDPTLPDRAGILIVEFPGADAQTIERLVAVPLEDELAQVSELNTMYTTARRDVVIVRLELGDNVIGRAIDDAWDDIEEAIERAEREFPEGVREPDLRKALIGDQEAIVFAVVGTEDRVALRAAAEAVEDALLGVDGVAEVRMPADPDRQVIIEYDDVQARRLGVSPGGLAQQLAGRNRVIPAGAVRVGQRTVAFDAGSDFRSLDELRNTPVALSNGTTVPLREVARVRLAAEEPATELMRVDGRTAVGIGVVADKGIDVVGLGERVRATMAGLEASLAPLAAVELSYQPDYVSSRLVDLSGSLMQAIGIVALVLVVAMGLRLGLLVTIIVPLVAMASIAIYAMGGGVLHQLSIAALVLSLGLLVDNAIVVAESAQHYIDGGLEPAAAARRSAGELWFPLAIATGTTIAAFVPMYASVGPTGDFTRAIPIVAMLTLSVSYLFAVFVTPVLSSMFLRRRARAEGAARFGKALAAIGVRRPGLVLIAALVAVVAAGAGMGQVSKSFFPRADRNQLVVEVVMPEGSHLFDTDLAAQKVEYMLRNDDRVAQVATFVGRSAPSFFYNLPSRPSSPNFAHIVLRLRDIDDIEPLAEAVRAYGAEHVPEADVIPRPLSQGPPLRAPIEVRLLGRDLDQLDAAGRQVMAALARTDGARNIRLNSGVGQTTVELVVDDAEAARRGLSRADVASALLRQTRGVPVGQLRSEADPIDIVLRAPEGENSSASSLEEVTLFPRGGAPVSLLQVATPSVDVRPAVIERWGRQRVVTVSAQLARGVAFTDVIAQYETVAPALSSSIAVEYGGSVEGAGKANEAIGKAAPYGAFLLIMLVLLEFNSFRRLLIILSTAPLAAIGIVPGLLLGDQPFGFMSLLGVFALIGIVVNNAIVLLAVVDSRRADGLPMAEALAEAVQTRTRPILLTTATTVAGLIPLTMSASNLWPPMAWAMITGLVSSTAMTLLVVPALYALLFRREDRRLGRLGSAD